MPEKFGGEARTKYDGLPAAEKEDPLAVADVCVNIMLIAHLLKEGPLSEFSSLSVTGEPTPLRCWCFPGLIPAFTAFPRHTASASRLHARAVCVQGRELASRAARRQPARQRWRRRR